MTEKPGVAAARAGLVEYDRVMNLGRRYARVDYSSDPTHVQYLRAVLAAHDAAVAERDALRALLVEARSRLPVGGGIEALSIRIGAALAAGVPE